MGLRQNLDAAFEALTEAGFLARQNFMCCSNCAGTALANEAEKLVDAGTPPKGCVFYHEQDAEVFGYDEEDEDGYVSRNRRCGNLMIRYGNLDTTKHGEIGLPTVEVGQIVCKTFDKFGVPYEWDNDPSSCIEVRVD
jgi:hypothetical protein